MTQLQIYEYALSGVVEARKKAKTPSEKVILTEHVSFIVGRIEGEKRLIKIAEERGKRIE